MSPSFNLHGLRFSYFKTVLNVSDLINGQVTINCHRKMLYKILNVSSQEKYRVDQSVCVTLHAFFVQFLFMIEELCGGECLSNIWSCITYQ